MKVKFILLYQKIQIIFKLMIITLPLIFLIKIKKNQLCYPTRFLHIIINK